MRRYVDCSRREFLLLACLLIFILFFAHTSQYPALHLTTLAHRIDASSQSRDGQVAQVPHTVSVASLSRTHILSLDEALRETSIVKHVPGWTILDSLYIFNGTIYVVTSNPEAVPNTKLMTSSGYEIFNGPIERAKRMPSERDIQIVSPEQARQIFKVPSASILDGVSFLVTDPKQFINHYYHWVAEALFGLWRAYASLETSTGSDGHSLLPLPRRLMFRHVKERSWTDYAGLNQWVNRGGFPGMGIEVAEDWEDRARMQTVFMFERVVLVDRAAAGEDEPFKYSWRTASNAFALPGNENWWLPLRRRVLEYSGVPERWIVGPDPGMEQNYVITYVSRQQWGRRKLIPEDHDVLVQELYNLRDTYGYEVNIVSMEKVTRAEQIALAARTDIMMGVHGNGLTSLIWMRPTPRSTVIEFFIPEGFAFDYEWTARACGIRHYAVWNDRLITHPNVQRYPTYPDGFQGNSIPLDGRVVADLVHQRLSEPEDVHAQRRLFLSASKPHAPMD